MKKTVTATVYKRQNVAYWRYVKPGAPTVEEGGARTMPKTNPAPRLHPRKLARSMAKARTGMNQLSRLDWRKAAADQRKGART